MKRRTRPPISREVVINLSPNTTTKSEKRSSVPLDKNTLPTGRNPSSEEIAR